MHVREVKGRPPKFSKSRIAFAVDSVNPATASRRSSSQIGDAGVEPEPGAIPHLFSLLEAPGTRTHTPEAEVEPWSSQPTLNLAAAVAFLQRVGKAPPLPFSPGSTVRATPRCCWIRAKGTPPLLQSRIGEGHRRGRESSAFHRSTPSTLLFPRVAAQISSLGLTKQSSAPHF